MKNKTNEEIISYLDEFQLIGEVSINILDDGLSIDVSMPTEFRNVKDYKRIKSYLHRNEFMAHGTGKHTRSNDIENNKKFYGKIYLQDMINFMSTH